ncbi:Putative peptidoglycan binding domain-containing protein [Cohaesibacter marisflavi]|uniref:Putative peptidoglycan binding domain-containing protein n=2 Tax=Cohaesibacter marisflavi TaxID=655353 RepID=A0A1I5HTE0_9HYPH|nr:peptidoglycan-binding protein [Cohaesibacter marisflavi]SFO51565.1 Putative peptidoglycan binding domain-containing protein [Cohaesibacter marisflavi]
MKKLMVLAIAYTLGSTQMTAPVYAGSGDFFAGALVGGAVGLIAGGANKARAKSNRSHKGTSSRSRIDPTQRENNRDLQRRLNELGYDAGTPDGVLGRRSKAAISAFQRDNGLPPTGKLSNEQTALLYQLSEGQAMGMNGGMGMQAPAIPGAAGPAFPSINNGMNNGGTLNGPAFPDIGGGNVNQMQIGTPSGGQFDNAMPSFGTPAASFGKPMAGAAAGTGTAAAVTGMPAVSNMNEAALDDGAAVSTANTDLSFASGQPSILGIELGESFKSGLSKLEENGYQNCAGQEEFITCSAQKTGVTETIRIARGLEQADVPVYLMDRTTLLKVDVDQSVIDAKIAEAYPEIAAAPHHILSNSAECAAYMSDLNNIDGFVNALDQLRQQEKSVNEWLEKSLEVCHSFYKLNVNHDGEQYRVRVILFDGSYLDNEVARFGQKNIDKVNSALKF